MSTDSVYAAAVPLLPISSYLYPDTIKSEPAERPADQMKEAEPALSETELSALLAAERAQGYESAERSLRLVLERKAEEQAMRVTERLKTFEQMQRDYFARVEAEVVQLALSIAGKILHREAQVDPMLVSAIVHLALAQLKDGSTAAIRVQPSEEQKWREYLSNKAPGIEVSIVGDGELQDGDCILETKLGAVNLSLEAQLKEIERGFFDLLACKPQI